MDQPERLSAVHVPFVDLLDYHILSYTIGELVLYFPSHERIHLYHDAQYFENRPVPFPLSSGAYRNQSGMGD